MCQRVTPRPEGTKIVYEVGKGAPILEFKHSLGRKGILMEVGGELSTGWKVKGTKLVGDKAQEGGLWEEVGGPP